MKVIKHFLKAMLYAFPSQAMRKATLLPLILISSFGSVFSQTTTKVSGTVADSSGSVLSNVTVTEKGSSTRAETAVNGAFTISISNPNAVLVFSLLGYAPKEVSVAGQTMINVSLQQVSNSLQDVVVVGYGTQKKSSLTGAVSVVRPEEIQKRQATTVGEALQGLATGVNVRGGGQPGSEASIQIRGLKNMSNANPLYVIDGMITTANRDFNPDDIESLQILKDASAAAIYGSRAANGVIIITTKKGKSGPMRIDFSGKASVQQTPKYSLTATPAFVKLNDTAYSNAGIPQSNWQKHNLNNNTDWQDAAFQTGNMQDYNLSFSGGGNSGSYLVSANYFDNKGTVISTGFKRIGLRVNTQGTKGIFSIGENVAITNAQSDEMSGNPYVDVVRMLPTISIYNPNNPGGYGYGNEDSARTFGTNPVAHADLEDQKNENFRVRGNVWSELKFLPYLKYRLNLGYETSNDHYNYFRKKGSWTLNQPDDPSIANENRARFQSSLIENTLNFNKTFGKHSVAAVVGQTYQHDYYEQIWGNKRNMLYNPTTNTYYKVLDQGNTPTTGGYINEAVLLSYLGRVEYSYDDKYLLNGVIRRDGTSRLGAANRWGNFPSVSAAWRISREKFFNVSWIDDLKLRASYGTLGSSNIGYWDYIPVINTNSTMVVGTDQHLEAGATQVKLVNSDLRWEQLVQQNYGFDAVFLQNRLSVTAEYFIAETKDVLTPMPILLTTGNDGGNPYVNAVTLRNKGFEFSATYRENRTPVKYFGTVNVTTLRNKVSDLGYNRSRLFDGNTVTAIGNPIGMWYLLQTDGLFQNQAEIDAYKNKDGKVIQPDAKPGDIRFLDNNGDGQITNDDKAIVGSPWPKWEMGLNLGVSYKNFDLTMNWFGSFGAKVYNGYHSVVDRFDDNSNYRSDVSPWSPTNTNTSFPRIVYATTLNSRGDTERWLEDGSFFRMKYISLGYTIPARALKTIGFSSAQISLSAQNLITFTKYQGLDPEFVNTNIFQKGFDNFAFPNLKTYTVSLQFGF
ncbi:TonB-dependent receptor [Danxiaibacter flavus]|uniref:TonB-dependent receptor n=1 Tax=Danxiaibacter flavus TaxID=3049108 RepID=A0ABV3ZA47_9BACT|nr:TonB-dependent receptor [Chitinophagaceae bacterium DXS]